MFVVSAIRVRLQFHSRDASGMSPTNTNGVSLKLGDSLAEHSRRFGS